MSQSNTVKVNSLEHTEADRYLNVSNYRGFQAIKFVYKVAKYFQVQDQSRCRAEILPENKVAHSKSTSTDCDTQPMRTFYCPKVCLEKKMLIIFINSLHNAYFSIFLIVCIY